MCVSNMEKEYLEYLKNELLEMALTNEDDKARKRLIEKEIPRNYVKLLAIADTHLGCYQDRRDILDYLANKVIQNDVDYVIKQELNQVVIEPDDLNRIKKGFYQVVNNGTGKSYFNTDLVAIRIKLFH